MSWSKEKSLARIREIGLVPIVRASSPDVARRAVLSWVPPAAGRRACSGSARARAPRSSALTRNPASVLVTEPAGMSSRRPRLTARVFSVLTRATSKNLRIAMGVSPSRSPASTPRSDAVCAGIQV